MSKNDRKQKPNLRLHIECLEAKRLLASDLAGAAAAAPMPGDADLNGRVDFADFLRLADNFGAENADWNQGDFDGDGKVGFPDFTLLSSHFGQATGTPVSASDGQAEDSSNDSSNNAERLYFQTFLRGDGRAHGEAEFEQEQEHNGFEREFEVELESAAPDTSYDVSIDGVTVGQISTNSLGDGRLKFSTKPDVDELLMPDDFPAVTDASLIAVGNIVSGAFTGNVPDVEGDDMDDPQDDVLDEDGAEDRVDDDDDDDVEDRVEDDDDDDDVDDHVDDQEISNDDSNDSDEVELEAILRGPAGVHGEAEFESEHGGAEREFEVEIEDAAASTSYAVAVDGIFAGELTTDSLGRGELKLSTDPEDEELPFPADFPHVEVNSIVTIGDDIRGVLES